MARQSSDRGAQSENGARSYAQAESAKDMLSFANPCTSMKKTNDHNDWWLPARRPLSTFRAKSMAVEVSPREAARFAESTFQPIIVLFSYPKKVRMSPVLGLAYRARGKPLSWPQARNIYNDRLQTVNGHVSPMTQRFSYKYPGALTDKSNTPGGGLPKKQLPSARGKKRLTPCGARSQWPCLQQEQLQ